MRMATCHPERKYSAKGLCAQCYHAGYYAAHREEDKARSKTYYAGHRTAAAMRRNFPGGRRCRCICARKECAAVFYAVPSAQARYCSRYCADTDRRTGSMTAAGYKLVTVRGRKQARHPLAIKPNNCVLEHWLVLYDAASEEGKEWLIHAKKTGWTIHHKNGKRADNRIENLELMAPGRHPKGWTAEQMGKEVDMMRRAGILQ